MNDTKLPLKLRRKEVAIELSEKEDKLIYKIRMFKREIKNIEKDQILLTPHYNYFKCLMLVPVIVLFRYRYNLSIPKSFALYFIISAYLVYESKDNHSAPINSK